MGTPSRESRWRKISFILGILVLLVAAVDSATKLTAWVASASVFLFNRAGDIGLVAALSIGALTLWALFLTPKWMTKVVPKDRRRSIGIGLQVLLGVSLLVSVLMTIGMFIVGMPSWPF